MSVFSLFYPTLHFSKCTQKAGLLKIGLYEIAEIQAILETLISRLKK